MEKFKFYRLMAFFLAVMVVFAASCKKDDDTEPDDETVELEFEYSVVNDNYLLVTSDMTGNLWIENVESGTTYEIQEGEVEVHLPLSGTYTFTFNALIDGATHTSDEFDVEIVSEDLGFCEEGLWENLTGGPHETKNWRMDITEEGVDFFDGPLYYSGHDEDPYWSWNILEEDLPVMVNGDEMTSFFNWQPAYEGNEWIMPATNYGTISFNCEDMSVTTNKFGVTESGSFSFDPETMKLSVSDDIVIPIDTGRVNEGQFEAHDLMNLRIYALTDSIMQLGVKRSYEDGNPNEWIHIYNFIVDGYEYPREEFTWSEPILTSFTENDLVGTWKFDDVAQDWIGWHGEGDEGTTIEANRLNNWDTREGMITTLESWGAEDAADTFDAADDKEFVFNDDGTCVLAGINNTYSVSNGVITFGDEITDEFNLVWIGISGNDVPVLDVKKDADGNDYSTDGIWIGQQNDGLNESAAVQLIKVED